MLSGRGRDAGAAREARAADALARSPGRPHADRMFVVDEATAAAIRAALQQGGELSAVVELRSCAAIFR